MIKDCDNCDWYLNEHSGTDIRTIDENGHFNYKYCDNFKCLKNIVEDGEDCPYMTLVKKL